VISRRSKGPGATRTIFGCLVGRSWLHLLFFRGMLHAPGTRLILSSGSSGAFDPEQALSYSLLERNKAPLTGHPIYQEMSPFTSLTACRYRSFITGVLQCSGLLLGAGGAALISSTRTERYLGSLQLSLRDAREHCDFLDLGGVSSWVDSLPVA